MKRWSGSSESKPQHLPANRATDLTKAVLNSWFSKVSSSIANAGLSELSEEELTNRLWNCDETAFATDTASKKILARRGEKSVHETGEGSGREYVM